MTLKEAEKILDEKNSYWDMEGDRFIAYYFTWMDDNHGRIGYLSSHYFDLDQVDYLLDPEDWDVEIWSDLTFGDAFHFATYIEDIYTEEDLIREAESLVSLPILSNEEAMKLMKEAIEKTRLLQEEIENA